MAWIELPEGVSFVEGSGGQPAVQVQTSAGSALVYLHGATVVSWEPAGAEEVLWCSSTAIFDGATAIRGGVPLCGPWFGSGVDGDRKPSHGWFRISSWTLSAARVNAEDGTTVLHFELDGSDAKLPEGQSSSIRAQYSVEFGPSSLTLTLTVESPQEDADLEVAMHTYLAVADTAESCVTGLDGIGYFDKVAGEDAVQDGAVRFVGQVDRVYRTSGPCSLTDQASGRRVDVSKRDSASTIVWNPSDQVARSMADVGAGEWQHFVCVEVGNVGPDAVSIPAGSRHTTTARYEVSG